MSTKGSFETMAEEKGVKQTPPPIKFGILGVAFTKILKIAGSKSEFLDFDF